MPIIVYHQGIYHFYDPCTSLSTDCQTIEITNQSSLDQRFSSFLLKQHCFRYHPCYAVACVAVHVPTPRVLAVPHVSPLGEPIWHCLEMPKVRIE